MTPSGETPSAETPARFHGGPLDGQTTLTDAWVYRALVWVPGSANVAWYYASDTCYYTRLAAGPERRYIHSCAPVACPWQEPKRLALRFVIRSHEERIVDAVLAGRFALDDQRPLVRALQTDWDVWRTEFGEASPEELRARKTWMGCLPDGG